jgi:signal transduction histidine kinase
MPRRALLVVGCTLVAALTGLFIGGQRVLERDRRQLYASYADGRRQLVEEAARGVEADLADIGDDLTLATTLLEGADSPQVAERELHAIATIKREYLAMSARDGDGPITAVSALDAPGGIASRFDAELTHMLEVAASVPGVTQASAPLAPLGDRAAWYRIFARRQVDTAFTVAVLVDVSIVIARMKLPRDGEARIAVVDPRGPHDGQSDKQLAAAVRAGTPELVHLIERVRRRDSGFTRVSAASARRAGLPGATAMAVAAPMIVDAGPPWVVLVLASTQPLQTQERTIARRVVVGGSLVLVLLLSAAAYVLHTTYRARSLRERVRHEERLLHSEKLITAGQLAAGIAHEIGTPLNVARGRVELSLSHLGKEHAEADNHRIVIDQIDRVARLLQQLLDYVRPAPASVQEVDLRAAVSRVSDLLAPQAGKRKVTLVQELGIDAATLRADPDQIQQILVNLALNAIDACERGGRVTIRVHTSGTATVLQVEDSGHGIPADIHKQVFDPFFTTKKRGQGTGLGLWVVAQLVHSQGGEIELESEVGKGTTIRIPWAPRMTA